ncbi:LapA family protein [Aestuariicella sp. G3-2]|uniref:LapA family protein n=1 Tax=Pseudomaricurvus albidus TaxID=2842452 RepID=UPI001C0B8EE7|nr:LapA family protein [Aestuariicella albida]
MAFVKKIVLLLILLAGLVVGVWFSTDNTQMVTVSLLGFSAPAMPLGLLICGVFALGTGLGYLVSLLPVLSLKNHNLSLKRKLNRRDKEIERLRRAPIKGKSTANG